MILVTCSNCKQDAYTIREVSESARLLLSKLIASKQNFSSNLEYR